VINRKKKTLHKTGSSAATKIALEREEKKEKGKKEKLLQHGVFVFPNPSKQDPPNRELPLLSGRDTMLSLWYYDSTSDIYIF